MKFVSLFAGIGGFDLGLERAGHICVGQVENADYPFAVLQKHWPNVPKVRDVKDFHGTEFGEFDLLTGGYPCQPFSYAGKREGENDPRHLWPEVNRIIRNVRPKFVLLENVPGHLSLGFGRVLGDLAESGYDARWDCIPAAAVSAPHLRDRVFILAERTGTLANGYGIGRLHGQYEEHSTEGGVNAQRNASTSGSALANAKGSNGGQSKSHGVPQTKWATELGEPSSKPRPVDNWWETEPNVGRVANGIPARAHRLRGLGNAVVPQVAQWIGLNWLPKETHGPD
jgi:DNA (cytosine-5)-methyltransferase 1